MRGIARAMAFGLAMVFVAAACGGAGPGSTGATPTGTASAAPKFEITSFMYSVQVRGKVRIGTQEDNPPFSVKNPATGKWEGFDVDTGRELAKAIFGSQDDPDKVIDWVAVTSQTRIPALTDNKADVIIKTFTINEERKKQIDFSDVYFRTGQRILVKKSNDAIKEVADLNGKTFCAQRGSTSEQNVTKVAPQAKFFPAGSYPECLLALQQGSVESGSNARSSAHECRSSRGRWPVSSAAGCAERELAPALGAVQRAVRRDVRRRDHLRGHAAQGDRHSRADPERHPHDRRGCADRERCIWTVRARRGARARGAHGRLHPVRRGAQPRPRDRVRARGAGGPRVGPTRRGRRADRAWRTARGRCRPERSGSAGCGDPGGRPRPHAVRAVHRRHAPRLAPLLWVARRARLPRRTDRRCGPRALAHTRRGRARGARGPWGARLVAAAPPRARRGTRVGRRRVSGVPRAVRN